MILINLNKIILAILFPYLMQTQENTKITEFWVIKIRIPLKEFSHDFINFHFNFFFFLFITRLFLKKKNSGTGRYSKAFVNNNYDKKIIKKKTNHNFHSQRKSFRKN